MTEEVRMHLSSVNSVHPNKDFLSMVHVVFLFNGRFTGWTKLSSLAVNEWQIGNMEISSASHIRENLILYIYLCNYCAVSVQNYLIRKLNFWLEVLKSSESKIQQVPWYLRGAQSTGYRRVYNLYSILLSFGQRASLFHLKWSKAELHIKRHHENPAGHPGENHMLENTSVSFFFDEGLSEYICVASKSKE